MKRWLFPSVHASELTVQNVCKLTGSRNCIMLWSGSVSLPASPEISVFTGRVFFLARLHTCSTSFKSTWLYIVLSLFSTCHQIVVYTSGNFTFGLTRRLVCSTLPCSGAWLMHTLFVLFSLLLWQQAAAHCSEDTACPNIPVVENKTQLQPITLPQCLHWDQSVIFDTVHWRFPAEACLGQIHTDNLCEELQIQKHWMEQCCTMVLTARHHKALW